MSNYLQNDAAFYGAGTTAPVLVTDNPCQAGSVLLVAVARNYTGGSPVITGITDTPSGNVWNHIAGMTFVTQVTQNIAVDLYWTINKRAGVQSITIQFLGPQQAIWAGYAEYSINGIPSFDQVSSANLNSAVMDAGPVTPTHANEVAMSFAGWVDAGAVAASTGVGWNQRVSNAGIILADLFYPPLSPIDEQFSLTVGQHWWAFTVSFAGLTSKMFAPNVSRVQLPGYTIQPIDEE